MKIYILFENPYYKYANPYIKTLIEGINKQYNDVEWGYGVSKFWNDDILCYDIIHIHWPNAILLDWHHDIVFFEKRILSLKKAGIKIVSTCHNLKPHYSTSSLENQLYDITYKYSDVILHLGNFSLSLFKEKYPNTKNYLLLHHVYDTIYTNIPSFESSINKLNLRPDYKYILCFGAFRSDKERDLIINISKYLRNRKVAILAPSFYKVPKRRNLFYVIKPLVKYLFYKFKYPNIITTKYFVDDEQLKYYYGASHISLIQRLDILNSGNVPLGFLMKNIIIGPNVGNVGLWLKETKNPIFEPYNIETLYNAIDTSLNDTTTGLKNYQYALKNLKTNTISSQLYDYYKKLLLSKTKK